MPNDSAQFSLEDRAYALTKNSPRGSRERLLYYRVFPPAGRCFSRATLRLGFKRYGGIAHQRKARSYHWRVGLLWRWNTFHGSLAVGIYFLRASLPRSFCA